jgi:hypothetical protein
VVSSSNFGGVDMMSFLPGTGNGLRQVRVHQERSQEAMSAPELEGAELDLAVARSLALEPIPGQPAGFFYWTEDGSPVSGWWAPSRIWAQGGPIIEREQIGIEWWGDPTGDEFLGWVAALPGSAAFRDSPTYAEGWASGPTPLIAAMRCYVASKQPPTA